MANEWLIIVGTATTISIFNDDRMEKRQRAQNRDMVYCIQ
jgi:hypothetical protein